MWVVQGATGPQGCSHYFPYPALLLLYDITNKDSFDNIQVSGFMVGVRAGLSREHQGLLEFLKDRN